MFVMKSEPVHRADHDIETRLRSLLVGTPVDNVPQTRSPTYTVHTRVLI